MAINFIESNDAGESLAAAVSVVTDQVMSLDSISGTLSEDADLFRIFLTGGQTFSAATVSAETVEIPTNQAAGIPIDVVIDPKIFLFDEQGNGVYANDDLFGATQSTLPSGPGGFSPEASGIYFLGISGTGYEAASANGQIFPSEPFNQINGPTGIGSGLPLTGFAGDTTASVGEYQISLTGAQTIAANDDDDDEDGDNDGDGNSPATLTTTDNNLLRIAGASATQLDVRLVGQAASEISEVLAIATDNEQGDINGISAGSDRYLQAALERATVLFSAFPAGEFLDLNPARTLNVTGGDFLEFATVSNGSLADLISGDGDISFVIANANNNGQSAIRQSSFSGNNVTLNLGLPNSSSDDLTLALMQGSFAQPIGAQRQGSGPESELIDLTGLADSTVTASIEVFREAAFDNTVGFYTIEDTEGTVEDPLTGNMLKPGDAGYQQAALANRINLTLTGENDKTQMFTAELETDKLLSTFIVVDATIDDLLGNSSFDADSVYFNHIGANADGKDHVRLFGDNIFGYEDLAGGGDMDFDDTIVKVTFA